MIVQINELRSFIRSNPDSQIGCVLDTNILFAAIHPLDAHNEWAEAAIKELNGLSVKTYTNLNVRSEFIELSRRVLIPECLIDLYGDHGDKMPENVRLAIRSLKTRMDTALKEDRTFKFSDQEIKRFKALLNEFDPFTGEDGWEFFCKGYLRPYILKAWPTVVETLQMEFLGTRAIENQQYFNVRPSWNEMVDIVGRFGIGVADAMILNLFLCSKFPLIVTTDSDIRDAVAKSAFQNKYVLAV